MKNFKIYQNIILLVSMLLLPMQTYSWHWYSGDVTTGAIIYNSVVSESRTIALGVNKHGHLNTRTGNIVSNAGATGLAYKWPSGKSRAAGSWQDATSPGCLCEGWGVSGNGYVGRAAVDTGGIYGLTLDSFDPSIANIKSVTKMGPTGYGSTPIKDSEILQITHDYGPAPEAQHTLFQGLVTISNISDGVVNNVRYRRTMDWDIPPTEFREYVSHGGVSKSIAASSFPKLIESCDNGFETPDPLRGCRNLSWRGSTKNVDFDHNGPQDHGSSFTFQFPDLKCGESVSFMMYYGVANTRVKALEAIKAVGADLYSLGASRASRDGITFIFAFKGVSGVKLATDLPPKAATLPSLDRVQATGKILAYKDRLYNTTFEYRKDQQWKGHLYRRDLITDGDNKGDVSTSIAIDAGVLLRDKKPSKRNIWTATNGVLTSTKGNDNFTTTNRSVLKTALYRDTEIAVDDDEVDDIVNFIRGHDSYDEDGDANFTEERDWKLADIYHANLVLSIPPSNSDTSTSEKSRAYYKKTRTKPYSDFIAANVSRKEVIYAAANDGMLHAFDAESLEELWAFVPPPVLDKLRQMHKTKGSDGVKGKSNSIYLVDGTPTIKDIYYKDQWRTILMAGLGYGGKGYYAIDITDPDSPSHLFSFLHDGSKRVVDYWASDGTLTTYDYVKEVVPDGLNYSKLSEAWTRPFITLIPYNDELKWVAVLGGGYAGADEESAGYARYIYIIDLEPSASLPDKQGTVLKSIELASSSESDIANGVVAAISAISADSASGANYYGILAYVSDLQGKTWKLDLAHSDKNPDVDKVDSDIFIAENHLNAQATLANDRLMYHKLTNSFVDGTPYHYTGTGDIIRLQRTDDTIDNRVFGIRDTDFPKHENTDGTISYTISSLEDGFTGSCPGEDKKGWYQDLSKILPSDRKWSKVTVEVAVDAKYVYFSAYSPVKSDSCLVDGKSNLIKLEKKCGTLLADGSSVIDLGVGIVGETTIYKGKSYTVVSNREDDAKAFEGGAKDIYKGEAEEGDGGSVAIPPSSISTESWRQVF